MPGLAGASDHDTVGRSFRLTNRNAAFACSITLPSWRRQWSCNHDGSTSTSAAGSRCQPDPRWARARMVSGLNQPAPNLPRAHPFLVTAQTDRAWHRQGPRLALPMRRGTAPAERCGREPARRGGEGAGQGRWSLLARCCSVPAGYAPDRRPSRPCSTSPRSARRAGRCACWSAIPATPAFWWSTAMPAWSAMTSEFNLVPDILKAVEIEEGRVFTMHLREGHRWSDGAPFTSEDFRYWWEDVATNQQLSPMGPPIELQVDGEWPQVEILDERTVRYSWSKPNPFFLPALAAAAPLFIYRPAHYLKQFHERYADPDELARLVEADRARDWAQLHGRRDRMYRFDNPDQPTLQPWMLQNAPPADRFVAVRNPYFHRVDQQGQQLPYIDRVLLEVVDTKLIPVKTASGRQRSPGARPRVQGLHVPQGQRGSERSAHAAVADRARRALRALSEPERQGRGLAGAVPRRPFPPRAVAWHQSRRHQSDLLLRPGDRRQQHGPAAQPAVQAGVPLRVGRPRSRAGQPTARPDRPGQARCARHPPPARRPADGSDHRDRGRDRRGERRPAAGRRELAGPGRSRPTSSRCSARCCATGSSPAIP